MSLYDNWQWHLSHWLRSKKAGIWVLNRPRSRHLLRSDIVCNPGAANLTSVFLIFRWFENEMTSIYFSFMKVILRWQFLREKYSQQWRFEQERRSCTVMMVHWDGKPEIFHIDSKCLLCTRGRLDEKYGCTEPYRMRNWESIIANEHCSLIKATSNVRMETYESDVMPASQALCAIKATLEHNRLKSTL